MDDYTYYDRELTLKMSRHTLYTYRLELAKSKYNFSQEDTDKIQQLIDADENRIS